MSTTISRRWLTLAIAFSLAISLVFVGTGRAGAADEERGKKGAQTIDWEICHEDLAAEFGVVFECGELRVPLDYDRPRGSKISVSLVRIPATAEPRLGSLFLNPGGPGGSGIEFALFFGPFAPAIWGPVANQYDIVGFDPRGIIASSPLLCFDSLEESFAAFPPIPFPITRDQVSLFRDVDKLLDRSCDRNGTKVLEHMSTANVARDMEQLRKAVGDRYLNFVGLSYGSYLGQTYANLYPRRVGAMVIDGVLDPVAWANVKARVPFSTALRSDAGAQATWEEFSRQCDEAGPASCPLAPDSMTRLETLLAGLREEPLIVTDPATGETFEYIYQFGVADLLGGLYNPPAWPDVAAWFAFLESQSLSSLRLGQERQKMQEAVGLTHDDEREEYPNFVEGFPAVACEDSKNPRGHNAWWKAGRRATADFGIFGEIWTWASSPCAVWSHRDRDAYRGPFRTRTAHPVLVIGNLYDPATRYEGALKADSLLKDATLLTVDEPGHTSLGLSVCAGLITGEYLADPSDSAWDDADLFCESGGNWFLQSGALAQSADDEATEVRTEVLDEVAIQP